MKKTILLLISLLMLLFLFSCTSNKDKTIEVGEEDITTEHTDISIQEEEPEDLSDLRKTPFKAVCKSRVKIRRSPSLDSDVLGYVDEGDRFEVYETYDDGEYIWNRIFGSCWVANNGKWLERIPYKENIDDYIVEIVKFPIPKETHEIIHSNSNNHIYDVDTVITYHDVDNYKASGRTSVQKYYSKYLDGQFEDEYYEESNTYNLASVYNPFINVQSGKFCSYEYDDSERLISIVVDFDSNLNNRSIWNFEYDENGTLLRAVSCSHDYSIIFQENTFKYDDMNRIILKESNSWNDNIAVKVDRHYYSTSYKYNGNIIYSEEKILNNTDVFISNIIKVKDGKVKSIDHFSKTEPYVYSLSTTDYIY